MTIKPGDLCYDQDDDLVLVLEIANGRVTVMSVFDSTWRWGLDLWTLEERRERGEKCLTKVV